MYRFVSPISNSEVRQLPEHAEKCTQEAPSLVGRMLYNEVFSFHILHSLRFMDHSLKSAQKLFFKLMIGHRCCKSDPFYFSDLGQFLWTFSHGGCAEQTSRSSLSVSLWQTGCTLCKQCQNLLSVLPKLFSVCFPSFLLQIHIAAGV